LKVGAPEALKVTVGTATAPQVGPSGKVTKVSLVPAVLMKGPMPAAPPGAAQQGKQAPEPPANAATNTAQ
jgi:hypothetical protein